MGRRLLPRFDSNGLGEHVERNRFLSGLKLAVTAKTMRVLQGTLPGGQLATADINIVCETPRGAST
jgi:hypothetical protein